MLLPMICDIFLHEDIYPANNTVICQLHSPVISRFFLIFNIACCVNVSIIIETGIFCQAKQLHIKQQNRKIMMNWTSLKAVENWQRRHWVHPTTKVIEQIFLIGCVVRVQCSTRCFSIIFMTNSKILLRHKMKNKHA